MSSQREYVAIPRPKPVTMWPTRLVLATPKPTRVANVNPKTTTGKTPPLTSPFTADVTAKASSVCYCRVSTSKVLNSWLTFLQDFSRVAVPPHDIAIK